MNELLRELEDDIRNERLGKLWNSFGRLMIGASVAVILGTIAVVVWQDRKQSTAMAETSQFVKGLDRFNVEDYKGAIAIFGDLSANKSSSLYPMAMLRKAQAQTLSGDKAAAAETYKTLAAHEGVKANQTFVALSTILAGQKANVPITVDKDSPLYHAQSEWKAWQLLEQGKKDEAVTLFTALRDDEAASPTQRERATQILEHLGIAKAKTESKASNNE